MKSGLSAEPRGSRVAAGAARPISAAGRDPEALASYLTPTHINWLATEPNRALEQREASLLFADVSGFTNLGERLARRGRIGAEQLTEAINVVFGSMVSVVGVGGGELVKFGGDAVLALFAGDNHEQRATGAALGIQDALAALRPLDGRRDAARLQVSAGVASGTAHLFLAGAAPRELIVAGPLASLVTALESEASPGEVLVSDATLAALPSFCAGKRRGDGTLISTPPPLVHGIAPGRMAGADPWAGLPLHLYDHEAADGEHRTVSVGFLQVRGTDQLLAKSGSAALAEALDEIVGAVCEACRSWGITLVSSDVDLGACKLIVCAGAPVASPDDDDRILHALLSITERSWPLRVRAGANRGPAFTGDIGPPERRVWSVMGDAVNLAARVMGKAAPGQLLATDAALARVRDDFARTPVEPFKVKGKSYLVNAAAVGGARGVARAAPAVDAPLVGRREELTTLRGVLAAARDGERRIVELVGEPGLGKSRLAAAVVSEAREMNVIRVQAGPYGAHTPYLAMRNPLRAAAGIARDADEQTAAARLAELVKQHEPSLARWLPLIAMPFGLELAATPETRALEAEFARQRLHGGVGYLLDALLPQRPSLILVEDAHWLDDASAALLRYLVTANRRAGSGRGRGAEARTDPAAGVAAVVTRRPVADGMQLDDLATERIELGPLAMEEASELVLDDELPLSPAQRHDLVARADGNPLLLQELVAAVRAGGSLDELPDSVEALMMARIDTLPLRQRRVLRDAAVLGIYVPIPELTELLGFESEILAATLEPLRGEFLVEEGPHALRFRHALLRTAAYNTLSFRRRRELHARAAAAIEKRAGRAEAEPELLAIHFHTAGRWRESWHYSRLAGKRALRNAAPIEATNFFASALEASRYVRGIDASERAEAALAMAEAAEFAGEYERAAAALSRARKLLKGDAVAEADVCLKQGLLAENSRHLSGALRWLTRGLTLLDSAPETPQRESVRTALTLAQGAIRVRAGRLREALPHLDAARAMAERANDLSNLAHAYFLLDWCYTDLALPESDRYRDLPLPIFEELGDHGMLSRVLNNLGVTAYYECRWEEAVSYYERGIESAEKAGDVVRGRSLALTNVAEIRIDQGRVDEAEELAREAYATCRGAGYRTGVGVALKALGRIASRRGEFDRAKKLLAESREELAALGSDSLTAEADAWEAERLVLADAHEAALERLDCLRSDASRVDFAPAVRAAIERFAGQAALAMGDAERGLAALRASAEIARAAGADHEEALAVLELARAGAAGPVEAAEARDKLDALGVRVG